MEFHTFETDIGAGVSATGYVIAFDPPGVLGAVALSQDSDGAWNGEIDRTALVGAPDCDALRSDVALAVVRDSFGLDYNYVSPEQISSGAGFVTVQEATRVAYFGMLPGSADVDGPLALPHYSGDQWVQDVDTRTWARSVEPGYTEMLVAHRGNELIAIDVRDIGLPAPPPMDAGVSEDAAAPRDAGREASSR